MFMTPAELDQYLDDGFLLLPELFSKAEVDRLRHGIPGLLGENSPRRVLESNGKVVRSVYGSHLTHPVFRDLTRDPRLLHPVERIIGDKVYVHQFKINAKVAIEGDVWAWHQDYVFWLREDGIREADLATAVVFIDEVNEFNGPLLLLPGSHKEGVVESVRNEAPPSGYEGAPGWIGNLTAQLKYQLDKSTVLRMAEKRGIAAPKGAPGSVLFFHPNIFHASPPNLSPFDRVLILITYNSVRNAPARCTRPEFLCGRDFRPLESAQPANVRIEAIRRGMK